MESRIGIGMYYIPEFTLPQHLAEEYKKRIAEREKQKKLQVAEHERK